MQKALKSFERALQRADHQRPKVAFAEETMNQVKGKLDAMRASVGSLCLTPFDSNEKIVIATAIQLYTVDLLSVPFHARQERELQACRQIARFALDTLTFE